MKELKPCPFCGGEDISVSEDTSMGAWAACAACGSLGPTRQTEEEAAEAWNHRYELSNEPLTLNELRQMDGEPAFFVNKYEGEQRWGIIHIYHDGSDKCGVPGVDVFFSDFQRMDCWDYGNDGWLAYRRRPEEKQK